MSAPETLPRRIAYLAGIIILAALMLESLARAYGAREPLDCAIHHAGHR